MKHKLLLFAYLIAFSLPSIAQVHLLATPEDAKKAIKVVMKSSSYSIIDDENNNKINDESEIIISYEKKDQIIISLLGTQNMQYVLNTKDYRKSIESKMLEKQYFIFNPKDTINSPQFSFKSSISSSGMVNPEFSIINQQEGLRYVYDIEKAVFIDKNGLAHNYYREDANSLEKDLLNEYFKSFKLKNQAHELKNIFKKSKNKVKSIFKKEDNDKKQQK